MATEADPTPRYRVADELILDSAVAVFASEGFDRAKMETIAARAGVTKPTLYARFDSKDALFAAAATREVGIRRDRLLAVYDLPASVPFRERLQRWVGEFFALAAERPDGFRLIAEGERHPAAADVLAAAAEEILDRIAAIVVEVSGRDDPVGARLVASMIAGTATGCTQEAVASGADLDRAAELCMSFVYAALRGLDPSLIAVAS